MAAASVEPGPMWAGEPGWSVYAPMLGRVVTPAQGGLGAGAEFGVDVGPLLRLAPIGTVLRVLTNNAIGGKGHPLHTFRQMPDIIRQPVEEFLHSRMSKTQFERRVLVVDDVKTVWGMLVGCRWSEIVVEVVRSIPDYEWDPWDAEMVQKYLRGGPGVLKRVNLVDNDLVGVPGVLGTLGDMVATTVGQAIRAAVTEQACGQTSDWSLRAREADKATLLLALPYVLGPCVGTPPMMRFTNAALYRRAGFTPREAWAHASTASVDGVDALRMLGGLRA